MYIYIHKSKAAEVLQMTLNASESQPIPAAAKGEIRSCEPDVSPAQRAMAPFTALTHTSVFNNYIMRDILLKYVFCLTVYNKFH